MSALSGVLSALGNAAAQLAEKIIPGGGALAGAAHSIAAAFETVKAQNGGVAPPEAQAQHDALFEKVKAHAESTLSRLEGR
jgi:hypothetical protein